ncbi:pep-cterm sorting domain-containing protein [Anaeramoeba ignava]|uniref:Pep-cterm sorting domain-containing protein n=1 Tax=Anaeramoeba ignava TaxID=1746090 RepID=A0A9Q0LED4_ANAIG|nr:pep-cterm sorting domain-containing protein [Anaeramoeba ignava]
MSTFLIKQMISRLSFPQLVLHSNKLVKEFNDLTSSIQKIQKEAILFQQKVREQQENLLKLDQLIISNEHKNLNENLNENFNENSNENFNENSNENSNENLNTNPFEKSTILKEETQKTFLIDNIKDPQFISSMKLGFFASEYDFSAEKFHEICDNKGKTLVIIETIEDFIFGGFTTIGWGLQSGKCYKLPSNREGYRVKDKKAFIFSLKNPSNSDPVCFPINPQFAGYALQHSENRGPTFGYTRFRGYTVLSDFEILIKMESGRTGFPQKYLGQDIQKNFLVGSSSFVVKEIEVYFV